MHPFYFLLAIILMLREGEHPSYYYSSREVLLLSTLLADWWVSSRSFFLLIWILAGTCLFLCLLFRTKLFFWNSTHLWAVVRSIHLCFPPWIQYLKGVSSFSPHSKWFFVCVWFLCSKWWRPTLKVWLQSWRSVCVYVFVFLCTRLLIHVLLSDALL